MKFSGVLPAWVLPVAIAACAVVIVAIGWRMFGGSGEVGPSKPVHAGMYDIMGELHKAQAAKSQPGGMVSQ